MESIKSYISKKIITLEGDYVGYVLNVVFDNDFKNLLGFVMVDEESEEELFLDKSNIVSFGQDCFVIESATCIKPLILLSSFLPLGKEIFSQEGISLGIVRDVFVGNFITQKVVSDKAEILAKQIVSVGKNCIIIGKKKKQKKENKFPQNVDNNKKVFITQINNNFEDKNSQKPIKLIGNINSVLGKIIKENIMGLNNEIIAKKGEKINKKIIDKALAHGKSNLLLFYSE